MPRYDFLIAGAGLAGACAALHLSVHGSVFVVERHEPSAGGSGAGLVNPILGLRARPVWRIEAALPALDSVVERADADDLYRRGPTLRPAYGSEQVERFRQTAHDHPQHASWISPAACADRFPLVAAPDGALLISTGGAIDVPGLTARLLAAAGAYGAVLRTKTALTGWDDEGVTLEGGKRIRAGRVILALGRGFARFPELARLRLHQVKGQTIRLERPRGLPDDLPHLAGRGYVAHENDSLVAGSTYEHTFDHSRPTKRGAAAIRRNVQTMLPSLREARVVESRAGVRVTVPGIRLPMIGPLPGRENVWIFTGFGAKGLLTAPLAAAELPGYFARPESIPPEMRVRMRPPEQK